MTAPEIEMLDSHDDLVEQIPAEHLYYHLKKRLFQGADGLGGDWMVEEIKDIVAYIEMRSVCVCGIAKDPEDPKCLQCVQNAASNTPKDGV